jgi:hypothetical protein
VAVDADDDTAPRSTIETRSMVHGDQATMLAERAEAAAFLRRMAQHAERGADLLREAAELYEQVGETNVWPWKAKHYMAEEVKQGLAARDARRSFCTRHPSGRGRGGTSCGVAGIGFGEAS